MTPLFQQLPIYLLQAHGAENQGLWAQILESNLINVLIAAGVIGFLFKKFNVLGGIDTQQEKIATELQGVEKRKQEALAQLEEAKRRTANLNAEVQDILTKARESADSLSAQIIADARTESAKIVDNAKKRVELEQRAAIKGLESRLLNEALSDARQEMARNLTPADQKRSVEAFLDELGGATLGGPKGAGR